MRLIDADALISDLEYDVDLDERALDCTDIVEPTRSTIQFDKDCKSNAIDLLKSMPTVEAIPVEWIKQFIKKENIHITNKVGIAHMVEQWKLHPIDFAIHSEPQWIPVSKKLPTFGREERRMSEYGGCTLSFCNWTDDPYEPNYCEDCPYYDPDMFRQEAKDESDS